MTVLFAILILAINLFILWRWDKKLKRQGKKLPWYWGWILPTDVLMIGFYSILAFIGLSYAIMHTIFLRKNETKAEMRKITAVLLNYEEEKGDFPENIDAILTGKPLRKDWKSDSWNTDYTIEKTENDKFTLISAGKDRLFDTNDDILMVLD